MKILEIANVDFSLRHFVLPLMRELRARGHEVVGVSADGPLLADLRVEGFRVETLPLSRSLSPPAQARAFLALLRLIRREKPGLVHAHMPISGVLARLAARCCGVPLIAYTCHGFLFNQPGSRRRRMLGLALEWLAGRVTDRYLTVSDEEAADARRLGIHRGAVAAGNGRSPAIFHPDPEARARVRAALGTPDDRVVAVILSRLVRHKGHPELLRALEAVPEVELWVVGERLPSDHGASLDVAFAHAAERLGPRLRRLGYRTDTAAVLAAADLFVLPSQFEGLPMSVIEAMLCGLPVIATAIRGPREQVVDGETGLLVSPFAVPDLAAAIRRLAADPEERRRMGAAGRERALSRYDEARVLARTASLLLD